jgi:hypothetical protein
LPRYRGHHAATGSQMANASIAAMASPISSGSAWIPDEEHVFSGGVLRPAQFYPAPIATPCERLLAAILEDAIRCFQKNCDAKNISRHIIFQEAESWLFDQRGTGFTSCMTVCESLGIDVIQLRRYLRIWRLNRKAGVAVPPLGRLRSASATREQALNSRISSSERGHTGAEPV